MERMQAEIAAGPDNISLEWTSRWLLFPTAMESILVNEDKQNANAKIRVRSKEDKGKLLKNEL